MRGELYYMNKTAITLLVITTMLGQVVGSGTIGENQWNGSYSSNNQNEGISTCEVKPDCGKKCWD